MQHNEGYNFARQDKTQNQTWRFFFLDNVDQTHPIYIKAALQKFGAERKNYSILRPDRRGLNRSIPFFSTIFISCLDLLSYLTGNADTSSSIDKSAPTEMGRPRPRNETQVNDVFAQNIKSLFWFQIL